MSTLEKRSVFWRVKIRCKGFPVQTQSFDTKAQAQRWARDIETEMDRGIFFDHSEAEKNTLGDGIARYLREATPLKKGAGPESSRLNALIAKPLAQIKMAALSSQHIAIYRDQRLKQVAPATVCKELNHIGHVIETARREWGIQLPENPVRMVRRRDRTRKAPGERRRTAAISSVRRCTKSVFTFHRRTGD